MKSKYYLWNSLRQVGEKIYTVVGAVTLTRGRKFLMHRTYDYLTGELRVSVFLIENVETGVSENWIRVTELVPLKKGTTL